MYSRIHHACEIATCMHLPDPVMLTAAAMIRSNSDLSVDTDPERSNSALRAIRNVQTEMGLGGKPDAAAARAQTTILATDFDLCANNRATRSNVMLGQTLRDKGWGDLIHVSPCFMNTYTCDDSLGVLAAAIDAVKGMTEIQHRLSHCTFTCRCRGSSWTTSHGHTVMWAMVQKSVRRLNAD